jgi:chromate transporter
MIGTAHSVMLGKVATGSWLTALIAAGSLAVLFRGRVSHPLLFAATAVVGLIASTILQPTWVLLK